MIKIKTLSTLAKETIKYFKHCHRNENDSFYCHSDNTPQWVINMTIQAHDGIMLNDFVFDYVVDALYLISEGLTEDEIEERISEIEPEIYNSTLLRWLSSNLTIAEYVNEAVQEYGIDTKGFNLYEILQYGNKKHKEEIAFSVLASLKEQIN